MMRLDGMPPRGGLLLLTGCAHRPPRRTPRSRAVGARLAERHRPLLARRGYAVEYRRFYPHPAPRTSTLRGCCSCRRELRLLQTPSLRRSRAAHRVVLRAACGARIRRGRRRVSDAGRRTAGSSSRKESRGRPLLKTPPCALHDHRPSAAVAEARVLGDGRWAPCLIPFRSTEQCLATHDSSRFSP